MTNRKKLLKNHAKHKGSTLQWFSQFLHDILLQTLIQLRYKKRFPTHTCWQYIIHILCNIHISSCKTNTSIQTFTHMHSYHQHNACNTHAETHTHTHTQCARMYTHVHTYHTQGYTYLQSCTHVCSPSYTHVSCDVNTPTYNIVQTHTHTHTT